jgi:glc operon protein GlcG
MRLWPQTIICTLVGLALVARSGASAQLAEKRTLTLEIVKQIAMAAEKHAAGNQWNMFIAIVDEGGNLMYLERMDDAQLGSLEVSIAKARSAVLFKRSTKTFQDGLTGGFTPVLRVPGAMPVEGGLPLVVDGKIIGAIGASGGTPQQDGLVAQAGVNALPGILQSPK